MEPLPPGQRPVKRPRSSHFHEQITIGVPARDYTAPPGSTTSEGKRLSCAECRRLKLKCNRQFPCESCCKRGVASICPTGALKSGQGSRFILTGTQGLHSKIGQMSDRIRELEDAVQELQSRFSRETHPVLAAELLSIKTTQELYTAANGTPSFPEAVSSNALSTQALSTTDVIANHLVPSYSKDKVSLPSGVLALSRAFPVPWTIDVSMRTQIRGFLPHPTEAKRLCDEAKHHALWGFNTNPSETAWTNLAHHVYAPQIEDVAPRRLALFLMILAVGKRVDSCRGEEKDEDAIAHADAYHSLARAALSETPLMEEPNFDLVHALFYLIWYQLVFSDNKKSVGYAWCMMGLAAKLSFSLGLHRDDHRTKIIPEEADQRRMLFWELMNLDSRLALSLGRPPSIHMDQVSVKCPTYPQDYPGGAYHTWKHTFYKDCLAPILERVTSHEVPPYMVILDLDSDVRGFEIPKNLMFWNADGSNLQLNGLPASEVLQRAEAVFTTQIALLQLHRPYCVSALTGPEAFTLQNDKAPSVIAVFMSARVLINTAERLYSVEPQLSLRFLNIWCNMFAAAVTLCLLISRAPWLSVASHSLTQLERVITLFTSAGEANTYIGNALPVIVKLSAKSQRIYDQYQRDNSSSRGSQPYQNGFQEYWALPGSDLYPRLHRSLNRWIAQVDTQVVQEPPQTHSPAFLSAASTGGWPFIDHFAGKVKVKEEEELLTNDVHPFLFAFPAESRVHGQEFNFDFGTLPTLTNDQSWMLWF